MAHCLLVDSDEELFGSDESDEEFVLDEEEEPEIQDSYCSDDSNFDDDAELQSNESVRDESTFLLSKCGKIQYSRDPPPLGRPIGRSSFSNKGKIIESNTFFFNGSRSFIHVKFTIC